MNSSFLSLSQALWGIFLKENIKSSETFAYITQRVVQKEKNSQYIVLN